MVSYKQIKHGKTESCYSLHSCRYVKAFDIPREGYFANHAPTAKTVFNVVVGKRDYHLAGLSKSVTIHKKLLWRTILSKDTWVVLSYDDQTLGFTIINGLNSVKESLPVTRGRKKEW